MTIARKMFVGYAALLIVMGSLLMLGSYAAVNQLIKAIADKTQENMMEDLARELLALYEPDEQWGALRKSGILGLERADGLLIRDPDGRTAASFGELADTAVERLGLKRSMVTNDGRTWTVYYVNTAVHFVGLFRYAFRDMLVMLLGLGLLVFIAISLFVSHWLAKRFTAPIRAMLPAVDLLGQGRLDTPVPVTTKDEYAAIAAALNDMSAALRQAEQQRKRLTADVAHELRTPLTIVTGKLDYWQQSLKPIAPEELLPLQDELIRLQRLVADLQELSKAEAAQLELRKAKADMVDMVARIVGKVSVEAEETGVTVAMRADSPRIEAVIDYNRITQVLLNIVMNSLRYAPGGAVTVTVAETADEVELSIADNGSGIEQAHIPNLFQRFYRTEQARSRHSGGTGLGLAIAWEYVKAHQGSIAVESEIGKGSTFTIRLPKHDDPS